jgi:hypothetical protein
MTKWLKRLIFAAAALTKGNTAAFAQDTGATTSENWDDSSIWTYGTVPGSTYNVSMSSTYHAGSAATATVTLTASESAANVYLGWNNSGRAGTLNSGTMRSPFPAASTWVNTAVREFFRKGQADRSQPRIRTFPTATRCTSGRTILFPTAS